MIRLTKIVHFETAHAIYGYNGPCKNIHGHSYELHVTVSSMEDVTDYLPAPGFIIDFKDIKKIVKSIIVDQFDHKMILSESFIAQNPGIELLENSIIWKVEPTAENMLFYIHKILIENFPAGICLVRLKLYETKDSYAEWIDSTTFTGR